MLEALCIVYVQSLMYLCGSFCMGFFFIFYFILFFYFVSVFTVLSLVTCLDRSMWLCCNCWPPGDSCTKKKIAYFLKFILQNMKNRSWNRKIVSCLHIISIFFFHYAYHRLWRGSMRLEDFMILFDVSFPFDVELTSILSYSMHSVTQSRCSLLFVSAADGDFVSYQRISVAAYGTVACCEVWQEWRSHDCS